MSKTPDRFDCPPFAPPFWLANAHAQTILPKFLPQKPPKFTRQWHLDSSGKAIVAYDFAFAKGARRARSLAVMFHGLEGSSASHYAKSFARYAHRLNRDAVVVHYRGCGGEPNAHRLDYHAGDTAEAHHALGRLLAIYPKLFAVGVSLGGNLLAKYMGEYGDKARVQAAVVASAPVDLASAAHAMQKPFAQRVYTPYLLHSLIQKAAAKSAPEEQKNLKKIKTLEQFDDAYTAARHGFGNAANYYAKASALPYLRAVTKPTLIVSSADDPFLGKVASADDVSAAVQLCYSERGGHVGFLDYQNGRFDLDWLAKTAFGFFAWADPAF